MELIYTDEACTDRGVLRCASGDFSVGVENTWSLDVPLSCPLREGCLVYVDGTELCGVVDDYETVTGSTVATVSGRTAQGVLSTNITCPPPGSDRLAVSGDANECIAAVLANVGLGLPFQVAGKPSGVRVDHELDRFANAYEGITSMLAASGAKLSVEASGGRVTLGAEPMRNAIGYDGETSRVRVRRSRAVNHLVCLGSGELQDRAVVHLYADEQGRVGTTQRIFGLGHMAAVYDYNNADEQELRAEGEKKLAEMQSADAAQLEDAIEGAWDIGDVVGVRFGDDGEVVSEVVSEKIARVAGRSIAVEYRTGSKNERGTIAGSSESSGSGGISYVAGDGISIAGGTISADVTQAELDAVSAAVGDARKLASDASAAAGEAVAAVGGKADKGHTHPYLPTTGGKVTGSVSLDNGAGAANLSVIRKADAGTVRATLAVNPDATTVLLVKNETAGAYINALKLKADRTELDKPLTIASGGTGSKTAAGALAAIGAAAKEHGHAWGEVDGKPTSYPPSHHVHRYAGAAEAGGAADSASKLATARAIKITGAVRGSAVFDGSRDVEISVEGDQAAGFLAAHPVGCYFETSDPADPGATYGGTWTRVPSTGPHKWHREA